MFKPVQRTLGLTFGGAAFVTASLSHTVFNDTKRKFYEDLENETPVPGTITKISKELLEKEAVQQDYKGTSVNFVDGMTVRSSQYLEQTFHKLRTWTMGQLDGVFYEYQTAKTSVNNELSNVKSTYNQIVVEPVLPSLIYILTGTLSGAIVSRNRSFPVRFAVPVLFGTSCFAYFMPQSFNNTRQLAWAVEKEQAPKVAEKHLEFLIKVHEQKKLLHDSLLESNECLVKNVHDARVYIAKLFDF